MNPEEKPTIFAVKWWTLTFTLPIMLLAIPVGVFASAFTIGFESGDEWLKKIIDYKK